MHQYLFHKSVASEFHCDVSKDSHSHFKILIHPTKYAFLFTKIASSIKCMMLDKIKKINVYEKKRKILSNSPFCPGFLVETE